jgi:hypothetical protein
MHAGAVEGQPAFATEGVIDGPVEGGAWGENRHHQRVRSQKAVTKKGMSVKISELAEAKHLR